MGMFDDIVCKYPLPFPEDTKGYIPNGFQTKDLDCGLDSYEIREDGTLWLRECEREHIEGDPNGKTFSEKFGVVKEIKHWWTHVKTTTTIRMYDYQNNDGGVYDYWVEFEIVFIDGVIDKIKLIKFEINDNTKRKELHKHEKNINFFFLNHQNFFLATTINNGEQEKTEDSEVRNRFVLVNSFLLYD